jgi:hypothetical protein
MTLMITTTLPTKVFADKEKADALVRALNADSDDGSTYRVESRVKDRWIVAMYGADGEFVGYL